MDIKLTGHLTLYLLFIHLVFNLISSYSKSSSIDNSILLANCISIIIVNSLNNGQFGFPRPLSFIEGVSFIEEFCSDLLYITTPSCPTHF